MYGFNRYMGPGCYRFLNSYKKIIYVGSAKNIDRRLHSHFCGKKGHLPKGCYNSVAKVEIIKTNDYATALALEQFLINEYKPKFNKRDKEHNINSKVVIDEDYYRSLEHWKLYHQFKAFSEDTKYKISKLNIISTFIYLASIFICYLITH